MCPGRPHQTRPPSGLCAVGNSIGSVPGLRREHSARARQVPRAWQPRIRAAARLVDHHHPAAGGYGRPGHHVRPPACSGSWSIAVGRCCVPLGITRARPPARLLGPSQPGAPASVSLRLAWSPGCQAAAAGLHRASCLLCARAAPVAARAARPCCSTTRTCLGARLPGRSQAGPNPILAPTRSVSRGWRRAHAGTP